MSQAFSLAMLDERLSLDICPSTEVTASWLQRQKVVALCGASGVSAEQARILTDWVREGGVCSLPTTPAIVTNRGA